MNPICAPQFVDLVELVSLAPPAEQIVVHQMVFVFVESATFLPHPAMPEYRWLRQRIVAPLPDGELVEMTREFRRVLHPNIG